MSWSETTQQREARERISELTAQRDHWKARAEHLASEKAEADMRYADTRYLLEGMARRASALRRALRRATGPVSLRLDRQTAAGGYISGVIPGRGMRFERIGQVVQEGGSLRCEYQLVPDPNWTPDVGERVTGKSRNEYDPDPVGEFAGMIKDTARIKHVPPRYGHTDYTYVDADTLHPAPSEREGDKQ